MGQFAEKVKMFFFQKRNKKESDFFHSKKFYDFLLEMYPEYYKWDNLLKK